MRILTSRAIATAAAVVIALTTVSLQPAAASHRGDAAAAAAFIGIFGTIAGLIAADQFRHENDDAYGSAYEGPGYPGPVYRGPGYGPRGHYWHRHDDR